jgi:hypothetical protein
MKLNSEFLATWLDLLPRSNEKLNAFVILAQLDKIGQYKDRKADFYDDLKVVLDATEGKKFT